MLFFGFQVSAGRFLITVVLLCVIEMASFGWMSAIISARSEMERNPGPTNLTKSTFQISCREPTSFALSFVSLWGCRIQSWTWPNEDEQRN